MINKIKQVFNKEYFVSDSKIEVKEKGKKATINKVTFVNADEFIELKLRFISYLNKTLSDENLCEGYPLCDELTFNQVGDGIFLAKKEDNWHLCACELKSNLGQNNFFKAKAQLEVSILKTLLLLQVIDSFENIKYTEGIKLGTLEEDGWWSGSVFPKENASSNPNSLRVYGIWTATHTESQKEIGVKYFSLVWINKDGKIAQYSPYYDINGIAAQLMDEE